MTNHSEEIALPGECDHEAVHLSPPRRPGDISEWVCGACETRFLPCLDQPVRPRADSGRGRLSGFQSW